MDFISNTRNTRRIGTLGLATLFALLSGCFTEPATEDGSATGGNCNEGSFGCECLAGACEPDLVCTPSNICIAENCTPGTAICECDGQGRCGPDLECTGNVCLPQGGTTVTPTSTDSDSSTSTTGTSTTSTTAPTDTMPTDTTPSTTSVDTSTSTSTSAETTDASDTTDPPASCAESEETCDDCFSCTHGNECEPEDSACDAQPGCSTAVACMQDCAVSGLCFDNCCAGLTPSAESAALALQTCREDTCIAGACRSYASFQCS
ncbi:MAG: hypothetical protein ACRBN8_27995 [Nannocystales bacterium]